MNASPNLRFYNLNFALVMQIKIFSSTYLLCSSYHTFLPFSLPKNNYSEFCAFYCLILTERCVEISFQGRFIFHTDLLCVGLFILVVL